MLNSGEFKKLTIALGLTLCAFSSSTFASDDLIIPEICVERAHGMGIFQNSKSVQTTRKKLEVSQASWQVFDFEKLYQSYANTLSEISADVEDYQSTLFNYLSHCRKNEKTCHGYFQPDNLYHVKIFCDREILRSSIETIMGVKDARFDKCVNQPFDELSLEDAEATGLNYDPKCFKTIEKDGKPYLSNKAHTQINEIKWVDGWRKKMIDVTINTIQKSLIPEGVTFILQKTIEEFDDLQLRKAKINDLNIFYRTSELIREFEICCESSNPMLPSGELSISYLGDATQNFHQSIEKPQTLTFQPHDYLSELVFQEADRQYWRNFFATKSPVELSESQRLAYFRFLQSDQLFPLEYDRTFSDFATEAKSKPRKEFKPKELTPQELKAYQKKLGYVYETPRSQKLQDYIIPREQKLMFDYSHQMLSFPQNQNKLIGNFLFNPEFQELYIEDLEKWNDGVGHKKFEEHKKIFYPRIFKSFLHYQFARTVHAKIIRELQKKTASDAKYVLNDFSTFYMWADSLTCKGFEGSYCTSSQAEFRRRKFKSLYEKIITEVIVLEFAPEFHAPGKRKYIYSDQFFNSINQQIQSINKYCWEIADPKAFKKDPASFNSKIDLLDQKIQAFYSTPRFEELLGQNDFLKLIKLDPVRYQYQCVTKGYAFGKTGYPSVKGHQLTSQISGYAANGAVPVYTRVDLYDYPVQEVFVPSRFQIEKDDLEDVEDEIEERIEEEFVTLKDVYRHNEFEEYKAFLEESATVRLLAMVDYALDNPSAEIGKYLCQLIRESDENEYTSMHRRQMIVNVALIATSVATIYALPVAAAGVSVLYEAGTMIAFSAISIGAATYDIKYYNHKNNITDMSVLTDNMKATDAIQLHQIYNDNISSQKSSIIANAGLLVVVGARPIFQSTKYIQKLLDKEYQLVRKTRQLRIEEFIRRSPAEKNEFYITQRMEDFLFDYKKVSSKEFDDFFTSFERGQAEGFVRLNWEKELGRFIPVKKMVPITPTKETLAASISSKASVLKKPFEWLAEKNSIYLQPYWYKLKPHINQYFLNHFNSTVRNEARLIKMIENARELSKKTGREIFSESEIKAFASKMKSFRMAKDGTFHRIADKALGKVVDRFMLRSVSGDSHAIRQYLEPMINGELLKKEEWELLLKSFNGQI
ncbi:MAG: hypothetical protein IT286_02735, partial [Proteobacteria bacterium]|nr:hypothetical protein [Pseudomonadota bacterium]